MSRGSHFRSAYLTPAERRAAKRRKVVRVHEELERLTAALVCEDCARRVDRFVRDERARPELEEYLAAKVQHYTKRAVAELADADPYLAGELAGNINALSLVRQWLAERGSR